MGKRVPQKIGSYPPPVTFNVPDGRTQFRLSGKVYNPGLARKICERIAGGETLNAICEDIRMPSKSTVVRWLMAPGNNDFREAYYYARRVAAEILMDEVIEIADNNKNDWKILYNKDGSVKGIKADNEAIQRSRVRIDTRKWLASKLIPRIYGEHVDVTHGVTGELAEMLQKVSNQDTGLPPPINGKTKTR